MNVGVRKFGPAIGVALVVAAAGCADSPLGAQDAGPGSPRAVIAATELAFGPVDCGGTSLQQVVIENKGDGLLTFSTSVTGTRFSATPAEGSVPAGKTASLTVTASLPATMSAGAAENGVLTIITNDVKKATSTLNLSAQSSGVTLSLMPSVASFGVLPVQTSTPALPLTLRNDGNVPATLAFVPPHDAQFVLSWTGAPRPVTVEPGQTVPGLTAVFMPTAATASASSANIVIATAVCGASVASIPMTGQGTAGSVGFSTTNVYFGEDGLVDCGTQSPSRKFSITNTGNQAFSWTANLGKGDASGFSFSPTSGMVPAGGSQEITVNTTSGIPQTATTAPNAFGDSLVFDTDVPGDPEHVITLHQTARGVALHFAPEAVAFGDVPTYDTATLPLALVNAGNVTATASLVSTNTRFTLSSSAGIQVPGGESVELATTFTPDGTVSAETAEISVTLDAPAVLCAPLPGAVTLSGRGTLGVVDISTDKLDFGHVSCGTTAEAQQVVFSNPGNQDYTLSATLGLGDESPFTLTLDPETGLVAANGGSLTITVTPSAIPAASAVTPNLYGDILTVVTDVPEDRVHDIPLLQTASGSIFVFNAASLNFGSVPAGATGAAQFTASNNGNAQGGLALTTPAGDVFSFTDVSFEARASNPVVGAFRPTSRGEFSSLADIGVTAGTVLCQPLSHTQIALQGRGTNENVIVLSGAPMTFGAGGLVDCGAQAMSRSLLVTNISSLTVNVVLELGGGENSPFTVAPVAPIPPGVQRTITVNAKPIPQTASTVADAFGDTLTLTFVGGVVTEQHVVNLHQTARGAVLAFFPTTLSFVAKGGQSDAKDFTLSNTGNLAAPYTLSLGGAHVARYSVTPSAGTVEAAGSKSGTVTFSNPILQAGARPGTMSVAVDDGITLCSPLPEPVTLNGTAKL